MYVKITVAFLKAKVGLIKKNPTMRIVSIQGHIRLEDEFNDI